MKQQIARLSPHQNGKVFGVMMAAVALIILVPFVIIASAFAPTPGQPPWYAMLLVPVVYLIFGYLGVAIGCLIYNLLYRFVGGIEYEAAAAPEDELAGATRY